MKKTLKDNLSKIQLRVYEDALKTKKYQVNYSDLKAKKTFSIKKKKDK